MYNDTLTKDLAEVASQIMSTTPTELNEEKGDKEAYQKFFNDTLKKYGVKSPSELKGADEKKFYDEIDAGWEADDEKKEVSEASAEDEIVVGKKVRVKSRLPNAQLVSGKIIKTNKKSFTVKHQRTEKRDQTVFMFDSKEMGRVDDIYTDSTGKFQCEVPHEKRSGVPSSWGEDTLEEAVGSKVLKAMIKSGSNPKEAEELIKKYLSHVEKHYSDVTPAKKAEIIVTLAAKESVELEEAKVDITKKVKNIKEFESYMDVFKGQDILTALEELDSVKKPAKGTVGFFLVQQMSMKEETTALDGRRKEFREKIKKLAYAKAKEMVKDTEDTEDTELDEDPRFGWTK